jgi:hypothetical protein
MGIDEIVWDVNGIKIEYTGNRAGSPSRFFDIVNRKNWLRAQVISSCVYLVPGCGAVGVSRRIAPNAFSENVTFVPALMLCFRRSLAGITSRPLVRVFTIAFILELSAGGIIY